MFIYDHFLIVPLEIYSNIQSLQTWRMLRSSFASSLDFYLQV